MMQPSAPAARYIVESNGDALKKTGCAVSARFRRPDGHAKHTGIGKPDPDRKPDTPAPKENLDARVKIDR
jgi:hypothetical protein